jgi:dipeptidyl aminopeptidase/acylaminoacyl peptidase
MIDFFHPTEPFGAHTQRLAAEAACSAADIFEIDGVCRILDPGDVAAWDHAWLSLAEAAEQKADDADRVGRRASAIMRFWHAASYYRQSELFFDAGDPRKPERFRRAQACFRRAAKLLYPAIRVIEVRCGEETYDGYFCLPNGRATDERVPAAFFIGGADSYAEENFFCGRAMLDRGIAMLLLDTPGRGSSIYLKNILARPDYEVPVAAALDWLAAQPDVDPERLGLVGIGMGSYYAPRGAAADSRTKALVCWSGIFSVLDDLYDFYPPMQGQLRWITGARDDAEARSKLAAYTLADAAPRITCPTIVLHGRHDRIINVEGARRFFNALGAHDKQLHIMDGAGAGHCSHGHWRGALPLMFDWLSEQLGSR